LFLSKRDPQGISHWLLYIFPCALKMNEMQAGSSSPEGILKCEVTGYKKKAYPVTDTPFLFLQQEMIISLVL
jgi:hypothetical protein